MLPMQRITKELRDNYKRYILEYHKIIKYQLGYPKNYKRWILECQDIV